MLRFSPRPNRAHLIHWREWGAGAFEEAAQQNKPLALFDTAFWCGFCQRMDETSLSDDNVINLLNAFFIPVRIEESQRPDVDLRYNQNGWPTISFFTARGVQLAGLNYTPPEDFVAALVHIVDFWQKNGDAVAEMETADAGPAPRREDVPLKPALVEEVAGILEGLADHEYGGYGLDLKLLHTQSNDFALYLYETNGERHHLEHTALTLRKLRESATFDARDGGFFRYSSRRDWQEPHPEKLLADQAGLLSNYLDLYLLTGDGFYRENAEGLVRYMEETLTADELRPFFAGCQDYLHGSGLPGADARRESVLDNIVYCDSNAQTASTYLKAWWVLGNEVCRDRALEIVDALWSLLRDAGGRVHHFYWQGERHVPGLLADALALGDALLDAYMYAGTLRYLEMARQVTDHVAERHRCPGGGFFDIAEPGPGKLAVRLTLLPKNAGAAAFFTRLADLTSTPAYREHAAWALGSIQDAHRDHGAFAAGFGHALARYLSPPLLVELTGVPGADDTRLLWRAARTRLLHRNVRLRFLEADAGEAASMRMAVNGLTLGPIHDPEAIRPDLWLEAITR